MTVCVQHVCRGEWERTVQLHTVNIVSSENVHRPKADLTRMINDQGATVYIQGQGINQERAARVRACNCNRSL